MVSRWRSKLQKVSLALLNRQHNLWVNYGSLDWGEYKEQNTSPSIYLSHGMHVYALRDPQHVHLWSFPIQLGNTCLVPKTLTIMRFFFFLIFRERWDLKIEHPSQFSSTVMMIIVLKIGLIGRLILFSGSPRNITLIALIMLSSD